MQKNFEFLVNHRKIEIRCSLKRQSGVEMSSVLCVFTIILLINLPFEIGCYSIDDCIHKHVADHPGIPRGTIEIVCKKLKEMHDREERQLNDENA